MTDIEALRTENEHLLDVIEDALQVAEMENRNLNLDPWASLLRALERSNRG